MPKRQRNASTAASLAVATVATGGLTAAAVYLLKRDREEATIGAGLGAVLGLAIAMYTR